MKKLIVFVLTLNLLNPTLAFAGANLGQLSLQKAVRNFSDQGSFANQAEIHLGEEVEFKIEIKSSNNFNVVDVVVSDTFPSHLLEYIPGSLTVNGQSYNTGLTNGGLRFSSISSSPTVIMYKAKTIQSGQSQDTSVAYGQNANQVSSMTSITIPARPHNHQSTSSNPNNTTTNQTQSGNIVNQNSLNEVEEHACLHVQNGPDRAISASSQTQGAPDVSRSHTRFNISLANNNNYVSFTPSTSGDYVFLFNQNLPIKILNSAGGEISSIAGASATCPSAIKRVVAELTSGTFYIQVGSGVSIVNLVIERAEQNVFNAGSVSGVNTFTAPDTGAKNLLHAFTFGAIITLIIFLVIKKSNFKF